MYSGPTKKMLELADFLEKCSPPVAMNAFITMKERYGINGRNVMKWYPDEYVPKPKDRTLIKKDVVENGNECGTACCIAGWTAVRWGTGKHAGDDIHGFAVEKLGIDDEIAHNLFYPNDFEHSNKIHPTVQRKRAIQVLRGEIELNKNWLHRPTKRK